MKLIFLDVDGVLNRVSTSERFEGCIFVEEQKVPYLKELVDVTGAQIVLTSTWRRGWYCLENGMDQTASDTEDIRFFKALQNKLREYGIELLGYTDDFGPRGKEIEKWLSEWNGEAVESFVILDDMEARELQPYADRLIQTYFYEGLTLEHVHKAIGMLGEKIIDQWTGAELKPGDPEHCQGNGEDPRFECCCDECDYLIQCAAAWGDELCIELLKDIAKAEAEEEAWMRVCAFKCLRCGDVLKREYKSPNDYGGGLMTCSCGHLTLDPTPWHWRVVGEDIENLCESAEKSEAEAEEKTEHTHA